MKVSGKKHVACFWKQNHCSQQCCCCQHEITCFLETWVQNIWILNINNLQGDLTDVSAKTKALVLNSKVFFLQFVQLSLLLQEFSAIRNKTGAEEVFDGYLVRYTNELATALEQQGMGPDRLMWQIGKNATHTEAAWMGRLPTALSFLGQDWWRPLVRVSYLG